MEPCGYCAAGLHKECLTPTINGQYTNKRVTYLEIDCCCLKENVGSVTTTSSTIKEVILGGIKANEEIRDPTSTGRKRAAQLKPIIEGMVCEWAGLRYAGGGPIPIVGCNGITLTKEKGKGVNTGNIHHGPDKSTLNNSDANLHRICSQCHNRWHALNDPLYGVRPDHGAPFVPLVGSELRAHDKHTLATPEQIARDEEFWAMSILVRPTDYGRFIDAEPEHS